MNWVQIATNDWNTYHDTTRIANFVVKGKITAEQYQQITGEPYPA
jgi:uncharacterized XkdX family phage protein